MTPQRIQRKRTRGWRMPADAIYVGRPSKWGNPYVIHTHTERCGDRWACPPWIVDNAKEAVQRLRHDLLYPLQHHPDYPSVDEIRAELAGHDLVCWCPIGQYCHGDLLLEVAAGRVG
jgi:uncharacterized protein DUF4326